MAHLAGPTYLKYVNFTSKAKIAPNTATTLKDMNVDGTFADTSSASRVEVPSSFKVVAKYGARALENGGPLQDLRALIYTTMQPWRPHQALHVGLADPSKHTFSPTELPTDTRTVSEEAERIRTGLSQASATNNKRDMIYLQWCKLSGSYREAHTQVDGRLSIGEETAFSPLCETVYVGKVHDLA